MYQLKGWDVWRNYTIWTPPHNLFRGRWGNNVKGSHNHIYTHFEDLVAEINQPKPFDSLPPPRPNTHNIRIPFLILQLTTIIISSKKD